jgi:hypothetical protein
MANYNWTLDPQLLKRLMEQFSLSLGRPHAPTRTLAVSEAWPLEQLVAGFAGSVWIAMTVQK